MSPTIGFSSIPVLNELHLVSSGSKSPFNLRGDSSYSWVFIRALDLWEGRVANCITGWELVTRSCIFHEEDKHSAWIQSLLITPKTS